MTKTSLILRFMRLMAVVGLSAGCDSPGEGNPSATSVADTAGDSRGGPELPPTSTIPDAAPVPAECVPGNIPCVTQEDCLGSAGTRCNTALLEPLCQTIRCGAEGTICSDDAHCPSGMACQPDRCGTCNILPLDAVCVNGEMVCLEGLTPCDGLCVDLQFDENHCGACNTRVPSPASCQFGQPQCPEDWGLCDGACELLYYNDHCGGCGMQCHFMDDICRATAGCEGYSCEEDRLCHITLRLDDGEQACDAVCATIDATCTTGYEFIVGTGRRRIPCDELATACKCNRPAEPAR